MLTKRLDREQLAFQFRNATPFPFVKIDNFLECVFAQHVSEAYPSFAHALSQGKTFKAVNERRKIQITNSALFPQPLARLNTLLASSEFLENLSEVTGIPNLLADEELVGGGMHITGPGGRLDVHVDFNYMEERALYRRLNLLLYLNPTWKDAWGGHIQFWNKDVTKCQQTIAPKLNRCVIFETGEISYHGVVPVTTDAPCARISFATYYYTKQAPPNWNGNVHSTIFKARPEEHLRKYVLMPVESLHRKASERVRYLKQGVKHWIGRSR